MIVTEDHPIGVWVEPSRLQRGECLMPRSSQDEGEFSVEVKKSTREWHWHIGSPSRPRASLGIRIAILAHFVSLR